MRCRAGCITMYELSHSFLVICVLIIPCSGGFGLPNRKTVSLNVLRLSHTELPASICLGGGTPMDENVQQQITLACIALLQKNAADDQQARKRTDRRSPTTKKEAIELLLKAASEPDI